MLSRPDTTDIRADAWALDKVACTESVIDITTRQVRCLRETEHERARLGEGWAGWDKRRRN